MDDPMVPNPEEVMNLYREMASEVLNENDTPKHLADEMEAYGLHDEFRAVIVGTSSLQDMSILRDHPEIALEVMRGTQERQQLGMIAFRVAFELGKRHALKANEDGIAHLDFEPDLES